MSMKHTSGPWRVDPKALLRVVSVSEITVAYVGCADSERDKWEANARLIAAAPELLDALLGFLGSHPIPPGRVGYERDAAARAAISKATGEQI